jgi:phi LC3 family holin
MINFKLRLKNKVTLLALIGATASFIYTVLGIFDIVPPISKEQLMQGAAALVNLLVMLGVLVDPTTSGIRDSDRAMEYDEPVNREAVKDADGIGAVKFKKRTKAPSKSEKWFYSANPFYLSGYGLPNCTAYAWGRFAELLGYAPKLSTGNAENWYNYNDGYKRGRTPKLGAVIVWAKGNVGNSADGAGHVAIVEEIYPDGSFLVSESGWKAKNTMWTLEIPESCFRAGYTFLGFIYNPAVADSEAVTKKKKKTAYTVGRTYTLQVALKVRASASTSGRWLKRSELTADAKKHAQNGDHAVLRKGTQVTCMAVKGSWIKIPSGWICCKSGSDVYVR